MKSNYTIYYYYLSISLPHSLTHTHSLTLSLSLHCTLTLCVEAHPHSSSLTHHSPSLFSLTHLLTHSLTLTRVADESRFRCSHLRRGVHPRDSRRGEFLLPFLFLFFLGCLFCSCVSFLFFSFLASSSSNKLPAAAEWFENMLWF